ncbi:hypothetical protein Maes01_00857 [Microbulbifer aestuariivivens]|uniref:Sulfotransferase family protein n=1 Tax=Microbulbifer aestuariivivens TaxID=1908308 RepID=A0ABP9WM64_9GAMM
MAQPDIQAKLNLVHDALARKDWRTATALCIEILKHAPRQADAHLVLGLASAEAGKIDMALRAFDTVLKIDPKRFDARIQKARCLVQAGHHAAAEAEAEQCIESAQLNSKQLDLLATIYSHIGKQETAEPLIHHAAKLAPNDAAILSNAAAIQLFVGQKQRAVANLERILERYPDHCRSHWQLAKARSAEDIQHCLAMESLLTNSDLSPQSRVYLHYALGKEYEDLQHWPQAWEHYAQGAALQRQHTHYQGRDDQALFNTLAQHFDLHWFDSTAESSRSDNAAPVFIFGLPRSGSTLVDRILSSHSQVQSLGELAQWPLTVKRLAEIREPGLFRVDIATRASKLDLRSAAENYLRDIVFLRGHSAMFTDKLPANFLYAPLLAKAFPNAKLVHVRRNPMDSCFAMYKQLFADAYPFSYTLEELADYYIGYHRLMAHWRNLLGDRLIEVDYDTLVQAQETQTRTLIDRLGLPFEPSCLEFHHTPGASATASAAQVRQPMHRQSLGRWRQFSEQLEPLRERLQLAGIPLDD